MGITLALLGAEVYLTDMEKALGILKHNVSKSFTKETIGLLGLEGPPVVEDLQWGVPISPDRRRDYDFVVGSDVTYSEGYIELLQTLLEVCSPSTVVYIGHLERGGNQEKFYAEFVKFFGIEKVHDERVGKGGICTKGEWVRIFKAKKLIESP